MKKWRRVAKEMGRQNNMLVDIILEWKNEDQAYHSLLASRLEDTLFIVKKIRAESTGILKDMHESSYNQGGLGEND